MDPYKPPESNLNPQSGNMPMTIQLAYGFMALSFCIYLINEIIYAIELEEEPFDIYNFVFIPIWGAILYWFSIQIRQRKNNPRSMLFFIGVFSAALAIFFPVGTYSIYIGLAEAVCLILAFLALSSKQSREWFS